MGIAELKRKLEQNRAKHEAKQLQRIREKRLKTQARAFRAEKKLGELKKTQQAKLQIQRLKAFKARERAAKIAKFQSFAKKARSKTRKFTRKRRRRSSSFFDFI